MLLIYNINLKNSFAMGGNMEERQERVSELNHDKIYREKINKDFSFNLPEDEKAEVVYNALVKERQLYLYYVTAFEVGKKSIYSSISSKLDLQLFEHLSFFSQSLQVLRDEWGQCTLEQDNYQSFIIKMDNFLQNEKKNKELSDNHNFSLLFSDPEKLESRILKKMLLIFCRVNAFNSLRLFLKLYYPAVKVDLSELLQEAIDCLHCQSVQTLVESGANIHNYFLTPVLDHDNVDIFMSPLYYAVWGPLDPFRTLLNVNWDNPKLKKMVEVLVFLGADPKQKCLAAPKGAGISKSKELNEDTITLAQEMSTNQKNTLNLNEEQVDFLNYIVNLEQKSEQVNSLNASPTFSF